MIQIGIALLVTVVIYVAALQVLKALLKKRMSVQARFDRYVASLDFSEEAEEKKAMKLTTVSWEKMVSRFPKGKEYVKSINMQLERGDVHLRVDEFLSLVVISTLAAGLLGLLFLGNLLGVLLFLGLGAAAPNLFLSIKCQARVRAFKKQIPDMLVLISNGMKAGYSFLQALNMVRKEMPSPMSDEFARLVEETSLGIPVEDALKSMADRLQDDDFELVVTAVIIQRSVGGNLAEVMSKIEHTIRERVKVKNEIKVLTAQGKLTGLILYLLPIGVGTMLYFIYPEHIITLFTHTVGQIMLAGGVVLMIIGGLLIRQIVDIKV